MAERCDNCGASVAAEQSFCNQCGHRLERPPRASAESGGHGVPESDSAPIEAAPTDNAPAVVFGDQRTLAYGNVTQTYHIQTAAGPAKRLCKICGTRQREDDCFECPRCKRWVCQTHQDPMTLLCVTCAEAIEAKSAREGEENAPSTIRVAADAVPRKPAAPQVISTVATLDVRSDPPGADVLLDSRCVGQTPLNHKLDLGVHRHRQVEVVVRKDGYQSQAAVIQLRRGALSEWHGVVLSRTAAADLPDPTEVRVREILVEPLDVEIRAGVASYEPPPGLPALEKQTQEAAAELDALQGVINDLRVGNHPSLIQAQTAVAQAREQCAKLNKHLEDTGATLSDYLRRRLADAAARNPTRAISELAKLAPRAAAEDLMRHLYMLRHVEHARRVADEAQASYERARKAKIEELQSRAEEIRRDLLPRLEADFADIVLDAFGQTGDSSSFPLEAWMRIEPLLAQRPYPWDRRALLAKAESLFQAWPDHRAWREAASRNTSEALREYLRTVPRGLHAAEAHDRLAALARTQRERDDSDWTATGKADTAADYQEYLSNHPDGRHAAEARHGLAWTHRRERSRAVGKIVARASSALQSHQVEQAASLVRTALGDGDNRRYPELWELWARIASNGRARGLEDVYLERVLAGHSDRVRAVRLTVDGERAVSAGWDKRLVVWDLRSRSCIASLEGHAGAVSCVAVHPDGRRAISGSRDSTLRVWDLDTCACEKEMRGHLDSVTGVEISADGRWAASASSDATVRAWDLEKGEATHVFTGHMGEVLDVVIDPADERIVSVGQDGSLRVWDLLNRTCVLTLRCGDESLNSVALSPDGRVAATAGNDRTVRLWELSTSRCLAVLKGHERPVTRVRFTADGARLVSTGRDKSLRLWDVASGELLRTCEGHGDPVTDVAVGGGDGWAITGSQDQTLRLWDLKSGDCLAVLGPSPGVPSVVAVHGDERILLAGSDRRIRCIDTRARRGIQQWGGHLAAVACVQVSPDGRRALSIDADRNFRLWDCESGQGVGPPEHCPGVALNAAFAADGRSVLVACADGSVHQYVSGTGTWRTVGGALEAGLTCVSIAADGPMAGGTEQGDVIVWHPATKKITARVNLGGTRVTAVALGAGGRHCAAIADQKLHFANLGTSEVVVAPAGSWRCVAISSDGNWAASGATDGELAVWDARTAKCLARFSGHEGPVLVVGFSPSGNVLVSGGSDARLRIWRFMWDLDLQSDTTP